MTEFVDDNMQSFITLKLFYSQGKKKKSCIREKNDRIC